MKEISTDLIVQAVYNLCYTANIDINLDVYSKILAVYSFAEEKNLKIYLSRILQNAKIAYEHKIPLCQDTGQVVVFLEIGQNIILKGVFIEDAINFAVEKCYNDNFFRKSIVKNAVFERENTKTNTPCIIYTKYTEENDIKIKVLIKGAGSENKSRLEMLLPTSNIEEIIQKCSEMILSAGINACPPMFIGIGIGGTADKALITSKEVFFEKNFTEEEILLAEKIKQKVNNNAPDGWQNNFVLDIKLKTLYTHIACLPVGITVNCHSDRFSDAEIKENKIIYNHKIPDFIEIQDNQSDIKEVNASDIEVLKSLKEGDNILLTGEIFVARDMAHKRMTDLLINNNPLPFNPENKIILYAGPCPKPPGKITGAIGPTTAQRMDKYAVLLYKKGLFATIGKGSRSEEIKRYIKENEKIYFTIQGGIAALLAQKIMQSEIIAFDDLGAEAIYKVKVKKLPVKIEIK